MHTLLDVVTTVTSLKSFRRLLVSLDAQTVAAERFRVVATPQGLDRPDLEKLRTLAAYRPNLVVTAEDADWWSLAVSASHADYLLPVAETERVAAPGLARVLESVALELDVVVARASVPNVPSAWAVFGPGSTPGRDELAGADVEQVAVVLRRGLVPTVAVPTSVGDVRRAALAAATSVEIMRGEPLVLGAVNPARAVVSGPRGDKVAATGTWSDGALHLDLSPASPQDIPSYATVRSLDSGQDWMLPVHSVDGATSVVLDPMTAADGMPLARGRWVLDVHTSHDTHPLSWARSPGSALLSGTVVAAVKGAAGRVVLDVGSSRRSPLRGMDPAMARIHEDVRGTRLDWTLPFVHVSGEARMPAVVKLGDFKVRAEVASGDGRASLGVWLTGLPSREAVSVSFGGSPFHATGHDLLIAHTGEMELLRAQPGGTPGDPSPAPVTRARRALGRVASRLMPSS